MPTECLASWKSPLLIGAAIGTIFLMIGIDMTVDSFVVDRGDTSEADVSGAVLTHLDGPILVGVGILCYLIGTISSCRKFFRHHTGSFLPCVKAQVDPAGDAEPSEGDHTRTTSVDTLTERTLPEPATHSEPTTVLINGPAANGQCTHDKMVVGNGTSPTLLDPRKQNVTLDETAKTDDSVPSKRSSPAVKNETPSVIEQGNGRLAKLSPLITDLRKHKTSTSMSPTSASPTSPTPLLQAMQDTLMYEYDHSSGSHSDYSVRLFMPKRVSRPSGTSVVEAGQNQSPLAAGSGDTDSSVFLSDETGIVTDSGETTASGSSVSKKRSRRDTDKYGNAVNLHSKGVGAVSPYRRSQSALRLRDENPDFGDPGTHERGIGAVSPETLRHIKDRISSDRRYGSSAELPRPESYPSRYTDSVPKRVNFLLATSSLESSVNDAPGYRRNVAPLTRTTNANRLTEYSIPNSARTDQSSVKVRKSRSFNEPYNRNAHLSRQTARSSRSSSSTKSEVMYITAPDLSVPMRPGSPVPPKSPRQRKSSSSSHGSSARLIPRGGASEPLGRSTNSLHPSRGGLPHQRSTSSSSQGPVDERDTWSDQPLVVRPWLTPPRSPTSLDGLLPTSHKTRSPKNLPRQRSTTLSLSRRPRPRGRQLPDLALCVRKSQEYLAVPAAGPSPFRIQMEEHDNMNAWI